MRFLPSLALLCLVSVSLHASDWPAFGHHPQRTGWAPEQTGIITANAAGLELEWTAPVAAK